MTALQIMDDTMTLEIGSCVVATARFSEHAGAVGVRVISSVSAPTAAGEQHAAGCA